MPYMGSVLTGPMRPQKPDGVCRLEAKQTFELIELR
jgi:hypothetical protein